MFCLDLTDYNQRLRTTAPKAFLCAYRFNNCRYVQFFSYLIFSNKNKSL